MGTRWGKYGQGHHLSPDEPRHNGSIKIGSRSVPGVALHLSGVQAQVTPIDKKNRDVEVPLSRIPELLGFSMLSRPVLLCWKAWVRAERILCRLDGMVKPPLGTCTPGLAK